MTDMQRPYEAIEDEVRISVRSCLGEYCLADAIAFDHAVLEHVLAFFRPQAGQNVLSLAEPVEGMLELQRQAPPACWI